MSEGAGPLTPSALAGDGAAAAREILAVLNALSLAEVSRLRSELDRARASLVAIGQPDLASRVGEAETALRAGNVKEFRRAIANVTARLGHVK